MDLYLYYDSIKLFILYFKYLKKAFWFVFKMYYFLFKL